MDRATAANYLTGVGDQLAAAVARGDRETAEQIVDRVDADGHQAAAVALGRALDATAVTTDSVVSEAARLAVERLVALSQWVDGSAANAARDPEALTWIRCAKVAEECGEVVDALNRATGANPRKPVGSLTEVGKELLDVALTALAAYEHLSGHMGFSLAAFFAHVEATYNRAGLNTAEAGE